MQDRIRQLVEALCSDDCAGRRPGSPGGRKARELVRKALEDAGLRVSEQPIAAPGGANLLTQLPGRTDRWVLVGAHYDHLGASGRSVFRGADDNAAAVAVLVEVARLCASRGPQQRGILFAAFDAEEPPYFVSSAMGSEHFAREPTVPLDKIDLMLCMDLVGHALGPPEAPADVRKLVFALGAERSEGTAALLDSLGDVERDVAIRRMDADIIPPLSDYWGFWNRRVPFVFFTCGRWEHYHTPEDTPDKLDYPKIAGLARWLDRFVVAAANRPEPKVHFTDHVDDRATARTLAYVAQALSAISPRAADAAALARSIELACDRHGRASDAHRTHLQMLVGMLESALA